MLLWWIASGSESKADERRGSGSGSAWSAARRVRRVYACMAAVG